jgi:hypothetical protein
MVDMKVDAVVHPVSDVDSANRFYLNMGWRTDADFASAANDPRITSA